jgi:hypothetical protein
MKLNRKFGFATTLRPKGERETESVETDADALHVSGAMYAENWIVDA